MNVPVAQLCLVLLCCVNVGYAQDVPGPGAKPETVLPSVPGVPSEAQPSPHFNAQAATDAYLAQIPAAATARSNAYFEGGYWLILGDFLAGAVIYIVLLRFGWSAGMRELAERLTRFKPLQTLIFWTEFTIVTSMLSFPLGVYEGFVRERQYGLATQ